jgi:hypothetical protein
LAHTTLTWAIEPFVDDGDYLFVNELPCRPSRKKFLVIQH